jgi:hypothetical protein
MDEVCRQTTNFTTVYLFLMSHLVTSFARHALLYAQAFSQMDKTELWFAYGMREDDLLFFQRIFTENLLSLLGNSKR